MEKVSFPSRLQEVRILILEDQSILAIELENQLEREGCDVIGLYPNLRCAYRLARDRLNNGEHILEAICQIAIEHVLAIVPRLPVGDVARAFEHEMTTTQRFQLQSGVYGQGPLNFRMVHEFAAPNPFCPQFVREFCERGPRHLGPKKHFLSPAQCLLPRVAVELLAAPIPFDDAAIQFPHENGRSRKLNPAFLLLALTLAIAQGLLRIKPVGYTDKCNHDTVDLVIDGPRSARTLCPPARSGLPYSDDVVGRHGGIRANGPMRRPGRPAELATPYVMCADRL
jgi:hypothetical protein